MAGGRSVLLRALRRALVASLLLFTFASVSGLWGLWAQQRELSRVVNGSLPRTNLLFDIAEQASTIETSLLRFMGYYAKDLGAARDALQGVIGGLSRLDARSGAKGVSTLVTRLQALEGELDALERLDDAQELDQTFARVSSEVSEIHRLVNELLATQRVADGFLTQNAAVRGRTLSGYVAMGLVVGWLLMAATMVFSLRRLQAPFENILDFMRRGSEKDLTGQLTGSDADELGELATAASALSGTLVRTIDSLRRVAGEARNRGTNLEIGALQASQGAESQARRVAAGEARARDIEAELVSVADLSKGLRSGAEQAASSVEQILAMTEEVRAEMEGITERVGTSTRAVEDLSQASTRMAALAGQVGVASQSVAASAAVIDQATETLSSGASEGRGLTEDVVHKADAGREAMAAALRGMERIREAVDAAVDSFDHLERELGRVGRVTQVIDDIAGRTNLLSLNAAIIAAQAGEQGKAFGVVATEIRGLAEKTARSTREIRSLVGGLVEGGREASQAISAGAERVTEGEQRVRHTGVLLGEIFESADRAARRLVVIEEAATGQSQEAARVAEEIRQVSEGMSEIVGEVQAQEARARDVHQDLVEIEQVARQIARAADEQTRGTELITHTMVEVSEISENVDDSIVQVGELLAGLRQDLEALGAEARKELKRIAEIEVEGKGLSALAGKLQLETSGYRLPAKIDPVLAPGGPDLS
ncbi:MAG TPA: methyl-accepting chemotaxis protein [Deferrisomatales bacterium]|nr:methyl-accepting chemotaxis protein [Deferrisomatales bacterium]